MFELVRAGFSTRRKMLRRVLSGRLGDDAEATLRLAGIDPSARAETLELPDWAALAHTIATGAPSECRLDAYAKLTLSLQVVGNASRRLPRASTRSSFRERAARRDRRSGPRSQRRCW